MIDSLKTTTIGITGIGVTWLEWVPMVVRVLVGLATFIYIIVKVVREIKLMKENK
jgi:hypothetical protein